MGPKKQLREEEMTLLISILVTPDPVISQTNLKNKMRISNSETS